jgi:hypothetical protein
MRKILDTTSTAKENLAGIYGEGELDPEATIRSFRMVRLKSKGGDA